MFTEISGLRINYICTENVNGKSDEDTCILFLHGWGANITLFDAAVNFLAPHFRIIAPDLPGFGESDEPKEPWSVDDYVDFVIAFCEKLKIKKCHIIAHSFGGRITIKLMARRASNKRGLPFIPEKIVLTGSAGIRPKKTVKSKIKARCYKIGKGILSARLVRKLFPNALENFRRKTGSADYNAASPIMRQCLVKVVNEDLTPLIPCIDVPTLLIWGEKDDAVPLSDGQAMEKLIADSGLVVFEGCGHYAFLEQSGRFCRIIGSFFNIE